MDVLTANRVNARASSNVVMRPSSKRIPAISELNATPTPHKPLLALPDDAPAQRVP